MISIEFCEQVKAKCPTARVGCITANVEVLPVNESLWQEIQELTEHTTTEVQLEDIAKIEAILQSRVAYKALGKDPSRYRLSADALLRRVIQGKGLYQVNSVVDIINFTSLKTGFSIGGYDVSRLNGDSFLLDVGRNREPYAAIGRGDLNIEFLPVLRDKTGPFGSPTSDSMRTQIGLSTTSVLLTVFDFYANNKITAALDLLIEYLEKYANATNIDLTVQKIE